MVTGPKINPHEPAQDSIQDPSREKGLRKIIHIDMDCFYAAVELLERPDLQGQPVAVGGNSDRRGVLTTCNYEARKYGVRSAMSTAQALKLCPALVLLPVRMDLYKAKSSEVFEIFREYTDLIEAISLDEAYLDVSGLEQFGGSATLIAQDIRQKIWERTSLTASAGVAPNKFLAKICSDLNKPNGQFVLTPAEIPEFLRDLPLNKIWGVGKKSSQKLAEKGLYTCSDVLKWSLADLEANFGSLGRGLYQYARGEDHRLVKSWRKRKSISVERTFPKDIPREQVQHSLIEDLFGALLIRLSKFKNREKELKHPVPVVGSLVVKVKFSNFESTTKEMKWPEVDKSKFVVLLSEALTRRKLGVRLIGMGVKFVDKEDNQLDLFAN